MKPSSPLAPGRFEWRGLLEGRLPPTPGFAERLRAAERQANAQGLPVELELDGGRFGLLARLEPRDFDPSQEQPSEQIGLWLEELLRAFPDRERRELSSTLRSSEQVGSEVREVHFGLDPRRGLEALARTRSAAGQPLALPRRLHPLWRVWLPIAGLVLLSLAWRLGFGNPTPALPRIELSAQDFVGVLTLKASGIDAESRRLYMELEPSPIALGGRSAWLEASAAPDRRTELAFQALIAGQGQLRWSAQPGAVPLAQPVPLDALWTGFGARIELALPDLPALPEGARWSVSLGF